jgi:hypothetical protein
LSSASSYQTRVIERKPGKYGVILLMRGQAAPRDGSLAGGSHKEMQENAKKMIASTV